VLATVDDLTKLLNRRHFLESLKSEFSHAQQYDRPLSVLMIDADDFKRINDRHGHSAGDDVLRAMAERCRAAVRRSDLVGRLGGEEFAPCPTPTCPLLYRQPSGCVVEWPPNRSPSTATSSTSR
jgi:diguanylate cyclase (GGDEF)-like protein